MEAGLAQCATEKVQLLERVEYLDRQLKNTVQLEDANKLENDLRNTISQQNSENSKLKLTISERETKILDLKEMVNEQLEDKYRPMLD